MSSSPVEIRQATPADAAAIHALLRPFVAQRKLLSRSQAELIELTRHGFVAMTTALQPRVEPDRDGEENRTDQSDNAGGSGRASDSDVTSEPPKVRCIGFAAVEIYSPKLAELQCLAVHPEAQRLGLGRQLVGLCTQRASSLGVMEVLAISSSEEFLRSCGFDYSLPDQKKALFMQLRPRDFDDKL